MVIAMAVDLGLTMPETTLSNDLREFASSDNSKNYLQRFPCGLEARRTFLGCYYLSSWSETPHKTMCCNC
jgi:hypothetical protein